MYFICYCQLMAVDATTYHRWLLCVALGRGQKDDKEKGDEAFVSTITAFI